MDEKVQGRRAVGDPSEENVGIGDDSTQYDKRQQLREVEDRGKKGGRRHHPIGANANEARTAPGILRGRRRIRPTVP